MKPNNITEIIKNYENFIGITFPIIDAEFLRSQITSLLEGMPLEEEELNISPNAWLSSNAHVRILERNNLKKELNQWREEALK